MKFMFCVVCIVFLPLVYAKSKSNYPIHWTLTLTDSMAMLDEENFTNQECQEKSYMRYQQGTPLYCIRKVKSYDQKLHSGAVYFIAVKHVKGEKKIFDLLLISTYPSFEKCRFEHQSSAGNCQLIAVSKN